MATEANEKARDLINDLMMIASTVQSELIYRGEAECYPSVSSGLYRECAKESREVNVKKTDDKQLEEAKQYVKDCDIDAIRAMLQHLGGKTNAIDFTKDLNIALFFACNSSPGEDGRVIFLRNEGKDYYTVQPVVQPSNMADAQKSVFVISDEGYIKDKDYHIYPIPRRLKPSILTYLRKLYGISSPTVYNDLSGFIRQQKVEPVVERPKSIASFSDDWPYTPVGGPVIYLESLDHDGNFVEGTQFWAVGGYEGDSQGIIPDQGRELPVSAGDTCLFWFARDGYYGINAARVREGETYTGTMKPKEKGVDPAMITVSARYIEAPHGS